METRERQDVSPYSTNPAERWGLLRLRLRPRRLSLGRRLRPRLALRLLGGRALCSLRVGPLGVALLSMESCGDDGDNGSDEGDAASIGGGTGAITRCSPTQTHTRRHRRRRRARGLLLTAYYWRWPWARGRLRTDRLLLVMVAGSRTTPDRLLLAMAAYYRPLLLLRSAGRRLLLGYDLPTMTGR